MAKERKIQRKINTGRNRSFYVKKEKLRRKRGKQQKGNEKEDIIQRKERRNNYQQRDNERCMVEEGRKRVKRGKYSKEGRPKQT